MARKEPHWVKLFLRELERTGNVRMAAEGAGIDFTSAYQRRKRHADFAERWAQSLGAFRDGSGQALGVAHFKETPPPPATLAVPFPTPSAQGGAIPAPSPGSPLASPASPSLGGGETAIHPDGKVIRVGPGRWSRRAEERFLATMAEVANVRRAAEAAGVSTTAVYARRLKHPDFAEAWEMALDTGKARLEAMLVEAAQRRFDPDTLPINDSEPQVSVGEAIHIVKLKRSEPGRGPVGGGGRTPRIATPEEAEKELIKRLKIFAARVQKEDVANGWSVHEGHSIPPGWVRAGDACCANCGGEISESSGAAEEANQANSLVEQ